MFKFNLTVPTNLKGIASMQVKVYIFYLTLVAIES